MKSRILFMAACLLMSCKGNVQSVTGVVKDSVKKDPPAQAVRDSLPPAPTLDSARYDSLMTIMANGDTTGRWPVKGIYPKYGAILPFHRIVAYYGNLYSKQMGVLGEYPRDSMLRRLQKEVARWTAADSLMPAIPALHYIAVTAQGSPGAGGKYRLRMPFGQIDTVISWARRINALVFLDVQVGHSTLQQEVPEFEKYLAMPQVHFGIDPEFSMKGGHKPGAAIGTFDAADINYTINYLAGIVKKYNLPPKILVIHRFTQRMVTNYKKIKPVPEVQVVMDMDGWGTPPRKVNTYKSFVYPEPVQFTGFKLFYKNDVKRVGEKQVMQPAALLKLTPRPVYIQYQ
ncbi:hypothetical protein V9K67_04835 [Paraflavisolibacter sp. H34]|uniref:hypothetical protein n=1 Tax=Huijunlia imazamoxiresistens TaxID=3127457 RepID=UPI00301A236E